MTPKIITDKQLCMDILAELPWSPAYRGYFPKDFGMPHSVGCNLWRIMLGCRALDNDYGRFIGFKDHLQGWAVGVKALPQINLRQLLARLAEGDFQVRTGFKHLEVYPTLEFLQREWELDI